MEHKMKGGWGEDTRREGGGNDLIEWSFSVNGDGC